MGAVGGGLRVIAPGAEGGGYLRDDGSEIAPDGEMRCWIVLSEGLGVDVDLDELRGFVPFWGVAEVEDPVQACAEEEDDVGFLERGAAGAGGVEGVRVGDDSFAHGRREEG